MNYLYNIAIIKIYNKSLVHDRGKGDVRHVRGALGLGAQFGEARVERLELAVGEVVHLQHFEVQVVERLPGHHVFLFIIGYLHEGGHGRLLARVAVQLFLERQSRLLLEDCENKNVNLDVYRNRFCWP